MIIIANLLQAILPTKLYRFLLKLYGLPTSRTFYLSRPPTYNQDGLITVHNADFMEDRLFQEAYELGAQTGSWQGAKIQWRVHVLCWAANHAQTLEGDFVECGVNKGGSALSVMYYVNFRSLPKTFYLLDTFAGFVDEYITEKEKEQGIGRIVQFENSFESVVETFKDFANVRIIRGPVPDTLPQVTTSKVAYLSIDMNNVKPEIAAAEYFWDKLVSGAMIVLDDYGWRAHIEQKMAFDKFAQNKGAKILSLPTGQELIIKP